MSRNNTRNRTRRQNLVPQTTTFPLHLPPEVTRALLRPRSDDDTRGTQVAGLPSFLVAPTASTTGSTQSIAPNVTQRNPLPWTLPNVRFRKLAFFDELAVVLPPTILQGTNPARLFKYRYQ